MEDSVDSFEDLASRLKAGHESAAEDVFLRYTHRLVGLARKQLPPEIARKVGPEDVVQSVLRSFFARYEKSQFDEVGDWNEFWRLLAHITLKKCGKTIAAFHTKGRDVRREINLRVTTDESGTGWDAVASDPTPDQAAMLAELIDLILRDLKPREQQIVVLALDGCPPDKIAESIVRSVRTVERTLEKLRKLLEQLRDENR